VYRVTVRALRLIAASMLMSCVAGVAGRAQQAPRVDAAQAEQGRSVWASECINCHGTQARGTETGPNIIRSVVVNRDRYAATPGSVLGPFLKSGHPTQSGKPSASFTESETAALAQFLRQRVNDTMRGSPVFVPGNVLTGDAKAGETYFNGEGGCAACHNTTSRSLAGIRSRVQSTVDLQQRMLFPPRGGGRGGAAPNPNAVTVTITPESGPALTGVLVALDDFFVTYRPMDDAAATRTVRRTPALKVVTRDPLQAHRDLLDRITDKQIHDVVAYLETLR
jgi:cytochrome c2